MFETDDQSQPQAAGEACSALSLAAQTLAQLDSADRKSSKKQGQSQCPALPAFDEASMLSEQHRLIAAGQPMRTAFKLSSAGPQNLDNYVERAMQDLQVEVGQKLNWVSIAEPSGKTAQVFILEAPVPEAEAQESEPACRLWRDPALAAKTRNAHLLLPLDTPQDQAIEIEKQRSRQANLARWGLNPNGRTEDIELAIEENRRKQAFWQTTFPVSEQLLNINIDNGTDAIMLGLDPNSPPEMIEKRAKSLNRKNDAVYLGLGADASESEIQAAEAQRDKLLQSLPDEAQNISSNLPLDTPRSQALQINADREKTADRIYAGVPIFTSDADFETIKEARQKMDNMLREQAKNDDTAWDEHGRMTESFVNKLLAAAMGVSGSMSDEDISEIYTQRQAQMHAAKMGLPMDTPDEQQYFQTEVADEYRCQQSAVEKER